MKWDFNFYSEHLSINNPRKSIEKHSNNELNYLIHWSGRSYYKVMNSCNSTLNSKGKYIFFLFPISTLPVTLYPLVQLSFLIKIDDSIVFFCSFFFLLYFSLRSVLVGVKTLQFSLFFLMDAREEKNVYL